MKELTPVCTLFARLLLHEIDAPLLQELQESDVAASLKEIGVTIPADAESSAVIEKLGVEYCAHFVAGPDQIPLVQSIWQHGSYEGKSVSQLRELAEAADLEFDREAARNAPIDHLGCILLLWAAVTEDEWTEASQYIAANHMVWSKPPLQQLAAREGFYAQIAATLVALIDEIQATIIDHDLPPNNRILGEMQ